MPVPFLDFPQLVQLEVLEKLDIRDIIFLSLLSKRTQQSVKRFGKSYEFSLRLFEQVATLKLKRNFKEKVKVCFEPISTGKRYRKFEYGWTGFESIEKHCKFYVFSLSRIEICNDTDQYIHFINKFVDHILETFKINYKKFKAVDTPIDISELSLWNHTKKLDAVEICPFVSQLEFIHENIKDIDRLTVQIHDTSYKFHGILTAKYLQSHSYNWLSTEALLKMQCRWFTMNYCGIPKADVNKMLLEWLAGGLRNLERFSCKFAEEDTDDVMQNIETVVWEEQPRVFRCLELKLRCTILGIPVNIRREDGLMASILHGSTYFKMHVWHAKYLAAAI